jgi:sulfide dehydrogenase [flavocytochrome c] flavoprotein subunit
MKIKRRQFLQLLAVGSSVALGFSTRAKAASKHVVVIGGGTGGATAAKYLKRADSSLAVTLIEKNASYTTCYMSNEVLSGDRNIDTLRFDYQALTAKGVNVIQDEVLNIDADKHIITTTSGTQYPYDRCIVSPGIDFRFDQIEGYDEQLAETVPHAWKAGQQTLTLRAQLTAMEDGGTVIIAAPPNPYRCPPAPYERASQIAHYLKRSKPKSKVLILDPKVSFSKQPLFEEAWTALYGYGSDNSMIEWISSEENAAGVVEYESGNYVTTEFGDRHHGDVINIIPPQKAGKIAFNADLVDDSGWCPINRQSFESTRHADIHIIGDACSASSLPKSGFAANSEAKVCARAIIDLFEGKTLANAAFTNACYSVVGADYAISVSAAYQLSDNGKEILKVAGSGGLSPLQSNAIFHKQEQHYAYSWYKNFTADVFK